MAICFFIVSSESNRTPRSRTTSEGLIVAPVPTVSDRSCDDSLLMAALDPIHIASVLSAFSCNRRELHHWVFGHVCGRKVDTSSNCANIQPPDKRRFSFCRAMLARLLPACGVRLSVTFVSCAKTTKDIFEIFSPSGSQAILVFFSIPNGVALFRQEPPNGKRGRRMQRGMKR